MSIKNVEMQDSLGNIYYPHTDASIVKFGETTVGASLSESVNILTPITGSTANAILLNIATLTNNKKYSFKASANSTGNVTINGKAFMKLDGSQIGNGGVKANKIYDFYYDGTADCVFILAKAEGDATVANVLAGKIFSNSDDTGLVGTLDLTNLVTGNIRAGVTINGVAGKTSVVDTADATATSAGNIVNGKTAYANGTKITGNATIESLGGKQRATSTITSSSTQKNFNHSSGNVFGQYYINVTGFNFVPAFIIVMIGTTFFTIGNANTFLLNGSSYYSGQDYIFAQGQILIPVPVANMQYTYYIYE